MSCRIVYGLTQKDNNLTIIKIALTEFKNPGDSVYDLSEERQNQLKSEPNFKCFLFENNDFLKSPIMVRSIHEGHKAETFQPSFVVDFVDFTSQAEYKLKVSQEILEDLKAARIIISNDLESVAELVAYQINEYNLESGS